MYTYMWSTFLKRKITVTNQPTSGTTPAQNESTLSTEEEDGGGTSDSGRIYKISKSWVFVETFWEGKNTHRIWAVFGFGISEYSLGEAAPSCGGTWRFKNPLLNM